jgi:tetratricopeptide (TPR) repeat protein
MKVKIFSIHLFIPLFLIITGTINSGCKTIAMEKRQLAKEYYNLGNEYYEAGQYKIAIDYYRKAVSYDPELLTAHINLSLALISEGNIKEANETLLAILEEDPQNTTVLKFIGYAYYVAGDFETSLSYYEKVLEISSEDLNALYNKAVILWQKEEYDRAKEIFTGLLELAGAGEQENGIKKVYSDTLFNLGEISYDMEDWESAAGYFEQYLEQTEEEGTEEVDKEALLFLAMSYTELENYKLALDAYEKLLAYDDAHKEAWMNQAIILLTKVQDPVKGIESLEKALSLGFNETEKINALLEDPDLIQREEVEELLKEMDVQPQEEESEEEETQEEEPQDQEDQES